VFIEGGSGNGPSVSMGALLGKTGEGVGFLYWGPQSLVKEDSENGNLSV